MNDRRLDPVKVGEKTLAIRPGDVEHEQIPFGHRSGQLLSLVDGVVTVARRPAQGEGGLGPGPMGDRDGIGGLVVQFVEPLVDPGVQVQPLAV